MEVPGRWSSNAPTNTWLNIVDVLEIESALHLMLDDQSVLDGPKASTSFLLPYNGTTFAMLIRHLLYEHDQIRPSQYDSATPLWRFDINIQHGRLSDTRVSEIISRVCNC